jgi:hypothetical protein
VISTAGERIDFLLRLSYLYIQLPCRFFQIETWSQMIEAAASQLPTRLAEQLQGVERTMQRWPEKNSAEPEVILNGLFSGVDTPRRLG